MTFPEFMVREKNKFSASGRMKVCPFEIVNYSDTMKEDVHAFLSEEFVQAGKTFEPQSRHKIYQDIKNNFILFLCMKNGSKIIGTVALCKLNEFNCELKAMYLNKNYQGKKLGYKLAKTAIDFAKNNGYKKIYLDSMKKYDRALHLYRSLGFRETARYNDNDKADIFMLLDL
ncbi:MAG: GNAT family N-acetyltransferase [Treponema sp.]|nr:GNAT family N-acetyltransferase [Treponema sp.]